MIFRIKQPQREFGVNAQGQSKSVEARSNIAGASGDLQADFVNPGTANWPFVYQRMPSKMWNHPIMSAAKNLDGLNKGLVAISPAGLSRLFPGLISEPVDDL